MPHDAMPHDATLQVPRQNLQADDAGRAITIYWAMWRRCCAERMIAVAQFSSSVA
jgi:hypothetical protein